jgi:GNAT superfamily N-acetyltransferase
VTLTAPEPIGPSHIVEGFSCGQVSLDRWLVERALRSEGRTARTYVVCDEDRRVAGYCCVSAGSLPHAEAPGRLRRNAPDPIPVIVLGRLAVDERYQGHGVGSGLVLDAMERTVAAADIIGVRGLLVNALSDEVEGFYLKLGFLKTPVQNTVVMPVETIAKALMDR